jgi:hypothetical protein
MSELKRGVKAALPVKKKKANRDRQYKTASKGFSCLEFNISENL